MIQALMLKIAALSLLVMVGQNPGLSPEFRAQATEVAHQALTVAETQLSVASSQPSAPMQSTATTGSSTSNSTPPMNTPSENIPEVSAVSQARIDIISPIPGKGLGRKYQHSEEVKDESNYIELGAVLYAADGSPVKDADMTITVNKEPSSVMHGTGDQTPIYVNGEKRVVPVYSLHYEFKSAGEYTFTFVANGLKSATTISVE